jgi:hypothetical protein
LIVIIAIGVFLVVNFLRKPVPTGDPQDLPLIGHQVAAHIDSASSHKHFVASAEQKQVTEATDSIQNTPENKALGPRPQ